MGATRNSLTTQPGPDAPLSPDIPQPLVVFRPFGATQIARALPGVAVTSTYAGITAVGGPYGRGPRSAGGVSDGIEHVVSQELDRTRYAIAVQFRIESSGVTQSIATLHAGTTTGLQIRCNTSNQLELLSEGAALLGTSTFAGFTAGTTHTVVVVMDRSGGPLTAYRNGTPILTVSGGHSLTATTTTIAFARRQQAGEKFAGTILEAAVWHEDVPTVQQALALSRDYFGMMFAPRRGVAPAAAGSSPTLTSSLSLAIQQAQALTAGLSTAVQAPVTASAVADAAVRAARTAQASLDAAVRTAASAVASLSTAVQASGQQTASINGALQLARSATVALDLAVQAHLSTTASVNLQVQAAASATASVNLQVQAGSSASVSLSMAVLQSALSTVGLDLAVLRVGSQTASLSAALQAARSAAAAIDVAIQAVRSASASVNLQVQDDISALASIDVAVRQARSAVAGVQLAIVQTATASASVDAVLMLQRVVSAVLGGAVSAARVASAGLSFYIDDGGVIVITGPIRLLAIISQEIAFEATIEQA